MRILLVEDDVMVGRSLDRALTDSGMAVDWVRTAVDCVAAMQDDSYAILLLDLGLPDGSGLDVLRRLRKEKKDVPVVIITARDDVATRIAGLDSGADDYVVKPFDFDELSARIRAVVRRHEGHSSSTIVAGAVELDIARYAVTFGGQTAVLPHKEFAIAPGPGRAPGHDPVSSPTRRSSLRLGQRGRKQRGRCPDPLHPAQVRQGHHPQRQGDRLDDPRGALVRSLRNQLLASLFALVTVLGALGGIGAYLVSRGEVDQSLDGQLRQIALNVGDTDNPVSPDRADGVKLDPEDAFVVTIWDMQGAPLSSDPSFHPPRPGDTGYANFAAQGEQWRAYALVGPNRTVQVAQRMVVRDEFAADSALRAVLPFAAMIPLGWLVVGLVVGRVLRPIRGVTEQLRRWGRSTTSPLVLDDVPDEIMPLALATNDLVTRLQSQLEFREQFISDAAHELRTPLTALRLQARNLESRLNAPEEASLLAEMEKGVLRMSDMVTKMLQLARADASAALRNPINVDLNEVIAGSLEQVMPMAIAKEIDLGVADSVPAMVTADPDEIRTLVTNLVENAVRYTPDGGTVDVSLRQRDSHVDLQVRDTGPGIPEHLLEQVFGRFAKVDGSDGEGSGLGLSLVRAIAERCGATATLANRRDRRGLVATVAFPVERRIDHG